MNAQGRFYCRDINSSQSLGIEEGQVRRHGAALEPAEGVRQERGAPPLLFDRYV